MDLVLIDICVQTPRDCGDYLSEFRHCKSLWNRFHHYYAYGTIPSCHQWKEDYNNCKEWEKHKTLKAKVDTGTLLCFHTQKYYFILYISSWTDCISDFYHLLDRVWKRQCNVLNTVISIFWHYYWQLLLSLLFAGCPADEWEKSSGRAKKVHTSMDDEARPPQWLAHATNPGKTSGSLNNLSFIWTKKMIVKCKRSSLHECSEPQNGEDYIVPSGVDIMVLFKTDSWVMCADDLCCILQ